MASKYNWNDIKWDKMKDDLDRIVAISRYYGSDPDFVLAGGGNTSMKTEDTLYIKASGTALADITRDGFTELARDRVRDIFTRSYSRDPLEREERVKTDMLGARRRQDGARPSIESMLHELINYKFVVHIHPNIVNGLTCARKGKAIARELFGDDALWIDYADPGYTLSKRVQRALDRYKKGHDGKAEANAEASFSTPKKDPAIIFIQNHGVFIGADNPLDIKNTTDGIVTAIKAYMSRVPLFPAPPYKGKGDFLSDQSSKVKELAPALRAILAATIGEKGSGIRDQGFPFSLFSFPCSLPIVTYNGSDLVREFVSSEGAAYLARSEVFTPDQIVYCKRNPLWISQKSYDENAQDVAARMKAEAKRFIDWRGYMPRIVLIQGMGMFSVGVSKQSADIAAAVYEDALKIMKNSAAFGGPHFMNSRQARFIDEWEVESYRRKVGTSFRFSASGRVAGKISVVTGAAQGFGEGIARDLASKGAYVVIADLNLAGAQELADELNKQFGSGKSKAIKTDVTDEESVKSMVAAAVREYGGIDILVSNAGVLRAGSVKEMSLKDFEFVTKVNYTGYFLCVKHAAPVMAAQHKYNPAYTSDIIQINSKSGLQGSNRNAAYAGSKFGGIGLTQSFALELIEDGIKVNSICPGNFFDGPLWSDPDNGLFIQYLRTGKVPGAKTVEDVRRAYESKIPVGRGCTVQDVMRTIYYVIEQPYETGQAVPVTGGQVMK